MKYFLNETNKFILQEKFILTEATFSLPSNIIQIINGYLKLIKEYSTENLQNIVNQLDIYNDDAEKIYNDADTYFGSMGKQAIEKAKENSLAIQNEIPQLKAIISKFIKELDTGISDIKRIKKASNEIAKLFNSWNISKAQLNKTIFNKNFNKVFDSTLTSNIVAKLPKKIIEAKDILDKNKNLNVEDLKDNIDPILVNIKNITDNLLPILDSAANSLENILKDANDYKYNETQDAVKNTTKEDWAAQLKKATSAADAERATKEIWKRYYTTEWASKAKVVEDLGQTFVQELLALSFDANLNPFVYFLKQTLLNSKPQTLNINFKNYIGLHNAFVNNYISEEDLKGTGFLGYGNIIFNSDLYNKSAVDIISYLKIQKLIKDKYATNQAADYFKDTTLKALYGKNSKSFIYHLFNKNKSALLAEDTKVTDKNLQTMQLKDLVSIEKELTKCFNYDIQDETSKATWSTSTGANIVTNLHNQDAIVNALKYLSTVYPNTNVDSLLKQYKETSQDNSYNLNYNKKFNTLFKNYAISTQNVEQVVTDIIKAANLTKI